MACARARCDWRCGNAHLLQCSKARARVSPPLHIPFHKPVLTMAAECWSVQQRFAALGFTVVDSDVPQGAQGLVFRAERNGEHMAVKVYDLSKARGLRSWGAETAAVAALG